MAKLFGAQRLVLQAILDLPKDSAGYVKDDEIARSTQIAAGDVRDWIETLEGVGFVEVAKTTAGLSTSITASGRQALRLYQSFGASSSPGGQSGQSNTLSGTAQSTYPAHQMTLSAASGSIGGLSGHHAQPSLSAAKPSPIASTGTSIPPVEVFFSYSHKDRELRDELEEHLSLLKRQGVVSGWYDRQILPGQEWAVKIDEHLESARVILLLVSPSFLASDYCYDIELKRALERHESGEAAVIPLIVRPCDWKSGPFARLAALPANWVAVTSWPNRDEAWTDVAQGIRRAVEALNEHPC